MCIKKNNPSWSLTVTCWSSEAWCKCYHYYNANLQVYGRFREMQEFLFTKLHSGREMSWETGGQTKKESIRIYHFNSTYLHLESTLNTSTINTTLNCKDQVTALQQKFFYLIGLVLLINSEKIFEGWICLISGSQILFMLSNVEKAWIHWCQKTFSLGEKYAYV